MPRFYRAGENPEDWKLDEPCISRRLGGEENQHEEERVIDKRKRKLTRIKKSQMEIRKPISLTITKESSSTNIYPDLNLDDYNWQYYEDLDKQNKDMIQIGAHLHYRQKKGSQYKFIGIVIEKKFGGTSNLFKKGESIECDYHILKIDSKKKSLGLGLCPNTIVPKIGEEHPLCIRLKKDGSPRENINGAMRYQYDTCSNSGITTLHTAPQRGILY